MGFIWRRAFRCETIFGKWTSFKNDEKFFLFHLKIFFRPQDIKVLSWFWSCRKIAWLERFKFLKCLTSQSGKRAVAINVLADISGSKSKQTMKFGQLIEYNARNILLEKSDTKYGEETIPRRFSEKLELSIFLDQ